MKDAIDAMMREPINAFCTPSIHRKSYKSQGDAAHKGNYGIRDLSLDIRSGMPPGEIGVRGQARGGLFSEHAASLPAKAIEASGRTPWPGKRPVVRVNV